MAGPLHQGVDPAPRPLHPRVLHGHRRRGLRTGRVQDHRTAGRPHHGRLRGRGPEVLHGAVGAGRGARHRPGGGLHPHGLRGPRLVPPQLAAGLEAVLDEQRGAVRIPLGAHVTGQVDGERGLRARDRVPDHRLPAAPALVPHEEPGVTGHRREAQHGEPQLLGAALGVVQLGHHGAVRAHHAEGGVHGVAVLGVLQGDERPVVRQVPDPGGLPVPVDLDRFTAGRPYEMDGGSVLVGGAADHGGAVAPDGEARRIRGGEARGGGLVLSAAERLAHPYTELVAIGVAEPPDCLAVRRQHPVGGPVGPVGHLALPSARPVPGVQLVGPGRVGHEEGAVRRVLGPVGQGHPGRAEPLLPLRHGRDVLRFAHALHPTRSRARPEPAVHNPPVMIGPAVSACG